MYWIEITDVNENCTLRLDNVSDKKLHDIVVVLSETGVEMKWGTYNPLKLQGGCLGRIGDK